MRRFDHAAQRLALVLPDFNRPSIGISKPAPAKVRRADDIPPLRRAGLHKRQFPGFTQVLLHFLPELRIAHGISEHHTIVHHAPVQVRIGAATFLADEPEDVGGLGSGPTPYELLCAALGDVLATAIADTPRSTP